VVYLGVCRGRNRPNEQINNWGFTDPNAPPVQPDPITWPIRALTPRANLRPDPFPSRTVVRSRGSKWHLQFF
jgi:hypothetical protein